MIELLTTALCAMTVFGARSADYIEVRPVAFETVNSIASGPVELLHELDRKSLELFCPLDSINANFGVVVEGRSPFPTSQFEFSLAMGIEISDWPFDVHAFNFKINEWVVVATTQAPERAGVRIIRQYVVTGEGFVDAKRGTVLVRLTWPNRVLQPVCLDYISFRFVE